MLSGWSCVSIIVIFAPFKFHSFSSLVSWHFYGLFIYFIFFILAAHPDSSFDVVLSNILEPFSISHTFELLAEIIKILKPNGVLYATEMNQAKTTSNLKLTGFHNIVEFNAKNVARFSAHKPAFEVGSSSQLSFANKPAVWSLSDSLVDDQVELVDEDDLLDADDFNKPDAESLRG